MLKANLCRSPYIARVLYRVCVCVFCILVYMSGLIIKFILQKKKIHKGDHEGQQQEWAVEADAAMFEFSHQLLRVYKYRTCSLCDL